MDDKEQGMTKTASRAGWTAFWVVAMLLVGAAVAWACTDQAVIGTPGSGPNGGSALQPHWGPPGTKVLVEGREFRQKQVEVRWNSASGPLLATGQGPSFSAEFRVPDRPPGDYTVVALQRDHNGDVDALARAAFKVTQGSGSPGGGEPGSASGSGSGGPAGTEAGRTSGSASGGSGARQPSGGQTTAAASGGGAHDGDHQAGRTSGSASAGQGAADPQSRENIGGDSRSTGGADAARQPQPGAGDGAQEPGGARDHVDSPQPAGAQSGAQSAPDGRREPGGQPATEPAGASTPADDAAGATPGRGSGQASDGADDASDSGRDRNRVASAPGFEREDGRTTPAPRSATDDLWSGLAPGDSPALPDEHAAPAEPVSGLVLGVALLGGGLVLLGGMTAVTLRRRRVLVHTAGR